MGKIPASRVRIPPSPLAVRGGCAAGSLVRGKPCFPRIAPFFFVVLLRLAASPPTGQSPAPAARRSASRLQEPADTLSGRQGSAEGWQSGRMRRSRKPLSVFGGSRVRIPPPPLHREPTWLCGFSASCVVRSGYGRSQILTTVRESVRTTAAAVFLTAAPSRRHPPPDSSAAGHSLCALRGQSPCRGRCT